MDFLLADSKGLQFCECCWHNLGMCYGWAPYHSGKYGQTSQWCNVGYINSPATNPLQHPGGICKDGSAIRSAQAAHYGKLGQGKILSSAWNHIPGKSIDYKEIWVIQSWWGCCHCWCRSYGQYMSVSQILPHTCVCSCILRLTATLLSTTLIEKGDLPRRLLLCKII